MGDSGSVRPRGPGFFRGRIRALAAALGLLALLGATTAPAGVDPSAPVNLVASSITSNLNPVPAGGTFTYTLTAYNSGTDPAANVTLLIPIQSQFHYASSNLNVPGSCAYSVSSQGVVCQLGTVAADPTLAHPILLEVTVTDTAPGPFVVSTTASVTTSSTESNGADNSQTMTVTVSTGADLAVTGHSGTPNPLPAGGVVTYAITAANNGPNNATGTTLSETLPPGIVYQSSTGTGWTCTPGGQLVTCTRPGPDAIAALPPLSILGKITTATSGTVTATATIGSATVSDGVSSNNTRTADVSIIPGTDLSIGGLINSTQIGTGQTITLTLVPRNLGPITNTNVTVTTTLPGAYTNVQAAGSGWTCTVSGQLVTCTTPSYAVNASNNLTITGVAPSAPIGGLPQIDKATITGDLPDPLPENNTAYTSWTVYPSQADLAIAGSKAPTPVVVGHQVSAVLRVRNLGPLTAIGPIPVTDVLSPGEEFVAFDPVGSSWTCAYDAPTRTVNCSYPGNLLVGSSPGFVITTKATQGGLLTSNICTSTTAGWPGNDTVSGNNCIALGGPSTVASADLVASKTVSTPDLAPTADTLVYSLTVRNNGPDTATTVDLSDDISSATGSNIAINTITGVTLTPLAPTMGSGAGHCTNTGNVLGCQYPRLLAGESATVQVALTRPMRDGTFTNKVNVYSVDVGDPNNANNVASVTSKVEPVADLAVTGHTATPATVQAGVNTTYVISVLNNGPSTSTSVSLTDVISFPPGDTGLTVVSATASHAGTCGAATAAGTTVSLTCTWPSLVNAQTESVTLVVRPNYEAGAPATRTFSSVATVSAATYDPASANNTLPATLAVTPSALDVLVLNSNVANPVNFQAGGTPVTYKLTVTNNGPSYGTGIRFVDSVTPPGGRSVAFQCDTANPADPCPPTTAWCGAVPAGATGATLSTTCQIHSGALPTGELATGTSVVRYLHYVLTGAPPPGGDIYSTQAVVTADEADTNPSNNTAVATTTILPQADLALTKTASPTTAVVSGTVTWTLAVTNNGPSTASAPKLTDTLPAGLVLVAVPTASTTGSVCTGAAGTTTVSCLLTPMPSGTSATVTVVTRVVSYATTLTNTATVSTQGAEFDPDLSNNTASGSVGVVDNSLTALVFTDLNNNGVPDAGEPRLANLQFSLSGQDDYGHVVSLTATSNAAGQIVFDGLAPSAAGYVLAQVSPTPAGLADHLPVVGTPYGGTVSPTPNKITAIVVTNVGDNQAGTGYAFPKIAASASLAGVAYSDTNSNGVRDAGEPGLGGVSVALTGVNQGGEAVSLTTTTAADGSFSFPSLAAANGSGYTLTATTPMNFTATGSTAGSAGGTAAAPHADPATVSAIALTSGTAATGYLFGYHGAGTLSGTVYGDGNRNGSQDSGETGLAGITVNLLNASNATVATTTTDASGHYGFSGLNAGTYTVTLAGTTGYGGPSSQPATLVLPALTGVNFGLTTATLAGLVFFDPNNNGAQDSGETGLAGVTVTLTPASGSPQTTTTAANGTFAFSRLLAGSATVTVTVPAGYSAGQVAAGSFGGTTSTPSPQAVSAIAIGAGQDGTGYRFAEVGTAIHGTVFLDGNRNGSQDGTDAGRGGVTVTLKNGNGAVVATTTTAADGSYTFPPQPAGSYTVVTTVPPGLGTSTPTSVPVTLATGTPATVNVGLTTSTIAGTAYNDSNANGVLDAGEHGIPGVTVTLNGTDAGGQAVHLMTTTDASGHYQLTGLVAGTYTLTETQPAAWSPGQATAGTFGGSAAPTVISAVPVPTGADGSGYNFGNLGNALTGLVFLDGNRNGTPDTGETGIAGGSVTLTSTLPGFTPSTVPSDANGAFAFTNLAAGSYTATLVPPAGYGHSTPLVLPVTLSASGGPHLLFGLTQGSLAGAVYVDTNHNGVRDSGEPGLGGVTLTLTGPGGSSATQVTDASGNYTFTGLAAGTYQVVETPPAAYGPGTPAAGSAGGTGANATTIGGIALTAGSQATGYLFGHTGSSVTGVVYVDANGNGQPDSGEAPVAGTTVTLLSSTGTTLATAVTDASGHYQFPGLTLGHYTVVVSPSAGYANTTPTSVPVTVAAGTPASANFGVGTAGLAGQVYVDDNRNGALDAGEPGLAGVTVQLAGTDVRGHAVALNTVTDGTGHYAFANLVAGTYKVLVQQPAAYAPGSNTAGTAGGSPGLGGANVIGAIPLAAGVAATGYLFGEVGATLDGTAYLDLNGNGQRDSGEPGIASVTVTLTRAGEVTGSTVTDADGRYQFGHVAAGPVTVTETPPAGYGHSTPLVVTGTVPAGGSTHVDFGSLAGSLTGGVFADSNRNGTPEAGEPPVPGAVITLSGTDAAGNAVSLTATADAHGRFTFPALRGGTYQLILAAVAGYAHGAATPGTAGGTSGGTGSGRITAIALGAAANAGNYLFAEYSTQNASIAGHAWFDAGHDRRLDAGDAPVSGLTVELLQGTTIVATTPTAADGSYQFRNVTPGPGYTVRFRDGASGALYGFPVPNEGGLPFSEGVVSSANPGGADNRAGTLAGLVLVPGQALTGQSLPLDPTGLVYDAVSRAVVPGATVRISGPSGFNPATELLGGAGNAVQTVGANGAYQFLLLSGAPLGIYTIAVTPPANGQYASLPSSGLIPPCTGPYTVGATPNPLAVAANNAPPALAAPHSCVPGTVSSTYYLAFHFVAGSTGLIVNNHLPLDPVLSGLLRVTKTTPLVNVSAGESVPYTVTATSTASREIVGLALEDVMPAGFHYHPGSGSVNGVRVEPTVAGRHLTWKGLTFRPGETKTFQLVLTVGIGTTPGDYVNSADAIDPGVTRPVSNVATATVRVIPDPTFDCPDLIGRVFDDANGNGIPDEGEKGIAGVRLVTVQGLIVTTDAEGRYHVACPMRVNPQIGSNYIVKLDERTLPTGYRLTTENPDTVRLTQGKVSKLNFGAALMHTVRLEIGAAAFDDDRLRQPVLEELARVASAQDGRPTAVTVVYGAARDETAATVKSHLALIREAVVFAWRTTTGRDPVRIDEDILRARAAPAAGTTPP